MTGSSAENTCGKDNDKFVALLCPRGHELELGYIPYAGNCDRCKGQIPSSSNILRCEACEFDLCVDCEKRSSYLISTGQGSLAARWSTFLYATSTESCIGELDPSPAAVAPPLQSPKQRATENANGGSETEEGSASSTDAEFILENGLLPPSLGSDPGSHIGGYCKACTFFPRGKCINGYQCTFCHFDHGKRRRSKKNKIHRFADHHPTGGETRSELWLQQAQVYSYDLQPQGYSYQDSIGYMQ